MSLSTAQDYILHALRKCGQMRPGYTPQSELLTDSLNEWGLLFDSWAAQRTMGFSIPDYTYPITGAGSQSSGNGYQIGPSAADWVGPRPDAIVRANLVYTSQGGSPVYIPIRLISMEEWASLAIRQMPGVGITSLAYYDPQFPNGVFNVFPPLNAAGNSIELFCWSAFAVPATLGTAYSAPPGYADAVVWNLAARLWPLVTKSMAVNKVRLEYLNGKAYEACQKVQAVNRPIPTLRNDFSSSHKPAGYYDSFVSYTGIPY